MGERPLTVSFAEPKQSEMAPQTAQDKVLYVGNLPESGTEEMVRDLFNGFGEVRTGRPAPSHTHTLRCTHFALGLATCNRLLDRAEPVQMRCCVCHVVFTSAGGPW